MLHTYVCLCRYENDSISDTWQGLLDSNVLTHNVTFFIIYLFLAVLGLGFCEWAFSSCDAGPSRCGFSCCLVRLPRSRTLAGSVVAVWGLSCTSACGIFPDQGLNPGLLHWQADFFPFST